MRLVQFNGIQVTSEGLDAEAGALISQISLGRRQHVVRDDGEDRADLAARMSSMLTMTAATKSEPHPRANLQHRVLSQRQMRAWAGVVSAPPA